MRKLILPILLSLFITFACESLLHFQMFSSDLFDLYKGEISTLSVNSSVTTEISEDDFEAGKDLIEDYFRDAKNFRLEKGDIYDNLVADYKIPVVLSKDYKPSSIDIFTIVLKPIDDQSFQIGLAFNDVMYNELNAYVEETFFSALDMDEMTLSFNFQNDLSEQIEITWMSSYVNGQASPISRSEILNKRDSQKVELSDIMLRAFSQSSETIYFGKLKVLQ